MAQYLVKMKQQLLLSLILLKFSKTKAFRINVYVLELCEHITRDMLL